MTKLPYSHIPLAPFCDISSGTISHAFLSLSLPFVAMDIASLVASSLGVADITVRVGLGLRQLQKSFSEALEHADNIAQQAKTIDFAIREICSLLEKSPDTFPVSFEFHLDESTTAIGRVVGQIQDHTDAVKAKAEKSPSRGKILQLWHADKVGQWEKNLGVQTQALTLLLQVANLRSNVERVSVLEQASSKRLFERASSFSARVGSSSRVLGSGQSFYAETKTFSFDPDLLRTKVYRRACESAWRQIVTENGDEYGDNCSSLSESCASSSNHVAVSSGDSIHGSSAGIKEISDGLPRRTTSDTKKMSGSAPQLVSETSTAGQTQDTNISSDTYATQSTFATTISSDSQPAIAEQSSVKPLSSASSGKSTVRVVVDTVGSDEVELPVCHVSEHYRLVRESIPNIRDRILVAGGIDPAVYQGAMTGCNIETSGQATHQFPFTAAFLGAALEKMEECYYSAIEVIAQFSPPPLVDDNLATTQTVATRSATVPHIIVDSHKALPFTTRAQIGKGGFGKVFQVKIDPGLSHSLVDAKPAQVFAVKKLVNEKAFRRESDILRQLSSQSQHRHIIKLLATFEHRQKTDMNSMYYLLFPWAVGDLRDFWYNADTPKATSNDLCSQRDTGHLARWVLEQCVGLADGLRQIHTVLNTSHGRTPRPHRLTEAWEEPQRYGRHGDIKPDNILWFRDDSESPGHLVIADFGLGRLHSSISKGKPESTSPKRIACTPTYRAPECDWSLTGGGPPVSQAYDIWSLGCVYLEFITWLLKGHGYGVDEFRRKRRTHAADEAFFTHLDGGEFWLSPAVEEQTQMLRREASRVDPPDVSEGLNTFLEFVIPCLSIDAGKRPKATTLAVELQKTIEWPGTSSGSQT
ncbi:kinase-like domain-containing protein [Cercophora scortea]|uniref:Kinase-like domain-containing protein n=1 Tax=Cercophora scortea TaxID=314031 RepID=A0AAE0INU1_9PEZI|nr:kinase-like domain-containing protein [Cercophora scortea]